MPAHALNWGKYPALLGLLLAQVTLVIGWLYARKNKPYLLGWLVAGIILSTFAHTRTLVLLFIILISWLLAGMWKKAERQIRLAAGLALLSGFALAAYLIASSALLKLTFDPYIGAGLPITLTVVLLSPFAIWRFPRMSFAALITTVLTLACLFVPVTLPAYGFQTLLDRPFVEMVLYFPLALLGGLGGAEILRLGKSRFERGMMRNAALLVLFLPIVLNLITRYDFYPSACCNLVSDDDLVALTWLDKNLPQEAVILIATTELRVLEVEQPQRHATDAGVWVSPLTGRRTALATHEANFGGRDFLNWLCRRKVTHVYIGGKEQSFKKRALERKTDWYAPVLLLPRAKVYNVIGCSQRE
ncbi:MAG: hypothetical protein Kow002_13110 [Anaerolineales bacterium]